MIDRKSRLHQRSSVIRDPRTYSHNMHASRALALLLSAVSMFCMPALAFGRQKERVNSGDRLVYVWIAPGSYFTGCAVDDKECIGWERPRQRIQIKAGFWIGKTEVTQEAYEHVIGTNPSRYRGDLRPVEQVDWHSARRYCNAVGMRLPTESEWEFAAAGRVNAPRYGPLNSIAWFDGNSGDQTHIVAQKQPNSYGLYDMLGNVWEWVEDPSGSDSHRRIMKGGSFYNLGRDLRVPNRETPVEDLRHRNVGFRCAAN